MSGSKILNELCVVTTTRLTYVNQNVEIERAGNQFYRVPLGPLEKRTGHVNGKQNNPKGLTKFTYFVCLAWYDKHCLSR